MMFLSKESVLLFLEICFNEKKYNDSSLVIYLTSRYNPEAEYETILKSNIFVSKKFESIYDYSSSCSDSSDDEAVKKKKKVFVPEDKIKFLSNILTLQRDMRVKHTEI